MANNANEENPFQDLLSAALSESGLTDDLDDLGGLATVDPYSTPIQTYTPTRQNVAQNIIRSQLPGGTVVHRIVNTAAGPSTPLNTSSVRPLLLNASGSRTIQQLTPLNSSTPTSGNKQRKSIVHIVTPKNVTGGTPQSGSSVKRVLQLQPTTASPGPAMIPQSSNPGAIKVIKIASSNANTTPSSAMTLAGGDGKTYRIVTVKSGAGTPQSITGQRMMSPASAVPLQNNIVRSSTGTPLKATTIRQIGPGYRPRAIIQSQGQGGTQTIKVLPSHSASPVIHTTSGTQSIRVLPSPTLGSTITQTRSSPQTFKVLPSQTSASFVGQGNIAQLAAAGDGQPIIIRTPTTTADGKTVTKVLKIIKPTISMVKSNPVSGQIPNSQSVISSNSSGANQTITSRVVASPIVNEVSSQPNATIAAALSQGKPIVTPVSQGLPFVTMGSLSQGQSLSTISTVSNKSQLLASTMQGQLQPSVIMVTASQGQPSVSLASVSMAKQPIDMVTTSPAHLPKHVSQASQNLTTPLHFTTQQSTGFTPLSALSSSTNEMAAIISSPAITACEQIPFDAVTLPSTTSANITLNPSQVASSVDTSEQGTSSGSITEPVPALNMEQNPGLVTNHAQDVPANSGAEALSTTTQVTPMEVDGKEAPHKSEQQAPVDNTDADWDMFGDGNLDLFSKALMELSETNKKARDFEDKHKPDPVIKTPVAAKPASATPPPLTNRVTVTAQPTGFTPITSVPQQQAVITMAEPNRGMVNVLGTGSGRNSPVIQLVQQHGRSGSPVTIIQRVNSPLTLSRPGSPLINLSSTSLLRSAADSSGIQEMYSSPGTPTSIFTPGSSIRRISTMPQLQNNLATTPVGQTVRRIIPQQGTRVTVAGGTPITGAQRVVIGNVNQGVEQVTSAPTKLTDRLVSQLWANDDIKLKRIASTPVMTPFASPASPAMSVDSGIEEEMEAEDEELGRAETYAEYMPPKLKVGLRHPDPVVETSSLSSVEPPNVFYHLSIPEQTIDMGALSALQLETIVYASQKHVIILPSGERAGFLVGDGAGVGKGRTIAGIIFENYLQGRKRALWLSVSNDLKVDAERDLADIGASKIEVHSLNKFKYAKISSHINGSVKKGVIFATYSSLIGESQSGGKYRTRFKQLLHWLGRDFDGPIIFDECHRAKNLCPVGSSKPTKTGQTVLELQKKLPKARIVYASATGASEPRNMAYMTRLGLWGEGTPFREFNDFIQAVEKRGVGAMELVAMDMKLRGMYIARQLSFHGVSFRIDEIPIHKDYVNIYNASVKLWVEARESFQKAAELISAEQRMRKTMWGQFWSAHQRFFKYLCISAKVKHCIKLARDAIKHGKCVVIGLQSTGEARTLDQLEESGGELSDFVSTAKGVFQSLVEKHFPAPDRNKTMGLFGWSSSIFDDSPAASPKASKRKRGNFARNGRKKSRMEAGDDDDDDFSSDSDKEREEQKEKPKSPPKPSTPESSDLSLSEGSDSDVDSDADDFNPFGAGSDSDDDPWLKKSSKKAKKKKKEKKEKKEEKDKREEKPEIKEQKVENNDKEKRDKKEKKRFAEDEDSDEFDDIDSQLDKVLLAAGLRKTEQLEKSKIPARDSVDEAIVMKRQLLAKIDKLGDVLPPNTLDELIDQLGGPDNVAEMTGRKGRVVSTDDGMVQYESRGESDTPLELMNLTEKQRFMDGEKCIAIISEAASSGISLQADRRVFNQKRRVHITLELPWSADRAIQQFGRTHRSNQVSAPEYIFLISKLAGEQRFASTVAKRLESLGALTHGDRRATESRDLSRFNIDNKFGRAALETVMKSVLQQEVPLVPPPADYNGNFFLDVKRGLVGVGMIAVDERTNYAVLEKEYNNISKFLNRILGMEVDVQNHLFKYFTDTLAAVILQAKRNGRWDMGILDLGAGDECVKTLNTKSFQGNFSGSNTSVVLYTISVERGLPWQKAMEIWRDHDGPEDGFYISRQVHNGKKPAVLVIAIVGRKRESLFKVYHPNTGSQGRLESLEEIKKKYRKVYPDDARMWWEGQFDESTTTCTHMYWRGSCRRNSAGMPCEVGLRARTYYVLSGSVLSVWTKVESVLASTPGGFTSRMQIIRLKTEAGKRIVGTLIPATALSRLEQMLQHSAEESPHRSIQYTPFQPKPSILQPFAARQNFLPSPSYPGPLASLNSRSILSTRLHSPLTSPTVNIPTPRISTPVRTTVAPPPSMMLPPSAMLDSDSSAKPATPSTTAPKQYLSMPMFL